MPTNVPSDMIGRSAALMELAAEAHLAASSSAKVLITGESGAGKELVARMVHSASSVRVKPLITVNCAGIPDTLLESELFGHVRGSFTGAYRDKVGRLQLADGGMIFLDEIGEMSQRMQALLLRFLETGEMQPLGATAAVTRVDARLVCATNRDLLTRVEEGHFRSDLYYRLNVIHLAVPALRERPEDIPLLVDHYVRHYTELHRRAAVRFSPAVHERLNEYSWPGNIRELKNIVERLVVRAKSNVVDVIDLPREVMRGGRVAVDTTEPQAPSRVDALLHRMISNNESFWTAVHAPFMNRDITRDDVRAIVQHGLQRTRGNYRQLIELFNMTPRDYRRFLNLLRKHDCHQPFQPFRTVKAELPESRCAEPMRFVG